MGIFSQNLCDICAQSWARGGQTRRVVQIGFAAQLTR